VETPLQLPVFPYYPGSSTLSKSYSQIQEEFYPKLRNHQDWLRPKEEVLREMN
jgi:hypothetical protein